MFAAVLILFAMKVWINDALSLTTPGAVKTPASIHLFLWNFGKVSIVVPMVRRTDAGEIAIASR